ncbi:hypothetical protein [Luteimonas aquatica]|uniref:hypothetical protein n=1 Tax=Luteimonas aquatica TaxID=450364 RepID=UPI001F591535|nr:hypothetical protein [Luteimonas aquatica]
MSSASVLRVAGRLAAPLLFALAFSAGAREPFVVLDANGRTVGPIMHTTTLQLPSAWVVPVVRIPFRVGDQRIQLYAYRLGFIPYGELYFESSDCTGQAYLPTRNGDLLTPSVVAGPRHTLYVPDGPFLAVATHSISDAAQMQCRQQNQHASFRTARSVIDLDDLYLPPFRVSASPEVIDLGAPAP